LIGDESLERPFLPRKMSPEWDFPDSFELVPQSRRRLPVIHMTGVKRAKRWKGNFVSRIFIIGI